MFTFVIRILIVRKRTLMRKIFAIVSILIYAVCVQAQTQENVDSLFEIGDYTRALKLVKQNDSIAKANVKLEKKSKVFLQDAKWYFKRGIYDKANEMLEEALESNAYVNEVTVIKGTIDEKILLQKGENKLWNRFQFGVKGGAEISDVGFDLRIGVSAKYGYYRDLVNITLGLEYNHLCAYRNEYDFGVHGIDGIGSQLLLPLAVRFNVVDMSEMVRFYMGVGVECGITLNTRSKYEGAFYSKKSKAMKEWNMAGVVVMGLAMSHIDVGLYYKRYIEDLVQPPYFEYMENNRVGINVGYYF